MLKMYARKSNQKKDKVVADKDETSHQPASKQKVQAPEPENTKQSDHNSNPFHGMGLTLVEGVTFIIALIAFLISIYLLLSSSKKKKTESDEENEEAEDGGSTAKNSRVFQQFNASLKELLAAVKTKKICSQQPDTQELLERLDAAEHMIDEMMMDLDRMKSKKKRCSSGTSERLIETHHNEETPLSDVGWQVVPDYLETQLQRPHSAHLPILECTMKPTKKVDVTRSEVSSPRNRSVQYEIVTQPAHSAPNFTARGDSKCKMPRQQMEKQINTILRNHGSVKSLCECSKCKGGKQSRARKFCWAQIPGYQNESVSNSCHYHPSE